MEPVRGGRGSYEKFGRRRPIQVTRTPAGSAFLSRSLHGDRRGRDKLIRSWFEKKKNRQEETICVFVCFGGCGGERATEC